MSTILKEKIIKKTRKIHVCNACTWLRESALSEIRSGNIKLEFSELRSVVKAKQTNWLIPVGSPCLYSVGIYNGDFFACYSIPEIHDICIKYEIYQED